MTSIKPTRFAEQVLSSTRISDISYNDDQAEHKDKRTYNHTPRRRRLRILDEEEVDFPDENAEPSISSSALPSSIPIPNDSTSSDDHKNESSDEDQLIAKSKVKYHQSMRVYSDEDETPLDAPHSSRLRTSYDPRVSVTERDRLNDRSPSVVSIYSEPEDDDEDLAHQSEPQADTQNDDVDIQALDRLRRLAKGASKRTVKRPRPKLDPECLLSDRGLPALLKECKRTKFKGKGHEFQDLDRLLFLYEAWANRLLPKSTFVEIIDRLERVGSRREIQVALQRLRNGIWPPYLSAERVENSDSDAEIPPQNRSQAAPDLVEDEEAAWERALRTVPMQKTEVTLQSEPPAHNILDDSFSDLDESHRSPLIHPPDYSERAELHPVEIPPPIPSTSSYTLAEQRAERNRRLALERLEAKRLASSQGSMYSSQQTTGNKSILKSALKAALANNTSTNSPTVPPSVINMDKSNMESLTDTQSSTQRSNQDNVTPSDELANPSFEQ